jgi:hypothetical protein
LVRAGPQAAEVDQAIYEFSYPHTNVANCDIFATVREFADPWLFELYGVYAVGMIPENHGMANRTACVRGGRTDGGKVPLNRFCQVSRLRLKIEGVW